MNMLRTIRFLLLLLFALLQCVAPLAHAHVNGDSVDQHVHIELPDYPGFIDHHHDSDTANPDVDERQLLADEQHTAVVSMPSEYRCSDLNVAQPSVATEQRLLLQCEYDVIQLHASCLPAHPLPPWLHPSSQAPPA